MHFFLLCNLDVMFLYVLHLFDVPRYELYGQFNDFTVLEYDEKLLRLCQPS